MIGAVYEFRAARAKETQEFALESPLYKTRAVCVKSLVKDTSMLLLRGLWRREEKEWEEEDGEGKRGLGA